MTLRSVTRNKSGIVTKVDGLPRVPAYLKSLRIPPAWTDVRVAPTDNTKLLVTGLDSKGRRQAIYSTLHTEKASRKKFAKVSRLFSQRESIRSQIELDCKRRSSEWREEAIVMYLIYETGIRPGSNAETKADKRAFGATTLQARHVQIMSSGRVWLNFVGKKGVRIKVRITNPWLVEFLTARKKLHGMAGWSTRIFDTTDARLRRYCATLGDGTFTPKDFRTVRANALMIDILKNRRVPAAATRRKRIVRDAFKSVAKALGNTPAVCRSAYVDPRNYSRFEV